MKLLFAILAVVVGTASAQAADLARSYTKAPPMMAPSWTGIYVGIGGGYGVSDTRSQNLLFPAGTFFSNNGDFGGRGYVGRVFGGYDYQFAQNWLVGVHADGELSDIRGRALNVNAAILGGTAQFDARQAYAVGGRFGYLVNPTILTYVNGGYTEAEFKGGGFVAATTGAAQDLNRPDRTYDGYFFGGGVEYALAPGWYAKSEYRYAEYNRRNTSLFITSTGAASNTIERNQPSVQTIIGGVSYKFNWR